MVVRRHMKLDVGGRVLARDEDFKDISEQPHLLIMVGAARGDEIIGQVGKDPERSGLPTEAHRGLSQCFFGRGQPALLHGPRLTLEALCGACEVAAFDVKNLRCGM